MLNPLHNSSRPSSSKDSNARFKRRLDGDKTKSFQYPHRLSFYTTPPLDEITIEEFEVFALDRLKGGGG